MDYNKIKLGIKGVGIQKLVIMLLCGVFLIVLSVPDIMSIVKKDSSDTKTNKSGNTVVSETTKENTDTNVEVEYTSNLENKLEKILRSVSGVGNVEVMITLKSSKELVTLKEEPYTEESTNETDSEGGNRVSKNTSKEDSTVLVTGDDGSTNPYITKELEPEVEGIIVIAEGATNASVTNEIMDAVLVLFDVPAHKIKVMKMN